MSDIANPFSSAIAAGLQVQLKTASNTAAVALAVAEVAGLLRVYVRVWILQKFGWDDWIMVFAQLLFLVAVIGLQVSLTLALNFFTGTVGLTLRQYLQLAQATTSFLILTNVTVKISVATSMLRFVGEHHRWERAGICFLTAATAAIGLVSLLMSCFTCSIIITDFGKACSTLTAYRGVNVTFGIMNCLTDLAFAGVAFVILSRMTMRRTTRLTAMLLFGIGSAGAVVSILRVVAWFQPGSAAQTQLRISQWSAIEAGTCITAACLFTVRPLVQQCFGQGRRRSAPESGSIGARAVRELQSTTVTHIRGPMTGFHPAGPGNGDGLPVATPAMSQVAHRTGTQKTTDSVQLVVTEEARFSGTSVDSVEEPRMAKADMLV